MHRSSGAFCIGEQDSALGLLLGFPHEGSRT